MPTIPDAWRARAPAMTERAWAGLARVLEHPDAPRYNRTLGDRVGPEELAALDGCRAALADAPREAAATPSAATVAFVEAPYQDSQVQNFQGGYVVPGGKWFRSAG